MKGISVKVFCMVLALLMLVMAFLVVLPDYKVEGAGTGEYTFTATNTSHEQKRLLREVIAGTSWLDLITGEGSSAEQMSTGYIAYFLTNSDDEWKQISRTMISWDTSSLPDAGEIISASIWVKGLSKGYTTGMSKVNVCTYACWPDDPSYIVTADYQSLEDINAYQANRLSNVISYDDWAVDGGWNEFVLNEQGVGEVDTAGWTSFVFRSTYDAEYVIPAHVTSGYSQLLGYFNRTLAAERPYLVVQYSEPVIERDITCESNADEGEGSAAEITDIVWGSPRCAYEDEYMCFVVSGDVNTPVELELQNEDGGCLESIEDVIRGDGDYSWYVSTSNYEGFLRCVEVSQDVQSTWGYLYESPASNGDFEYNHTYAKYTSYPQNDIEFSEYVVTEQELMFFHWKTNVQDDELGAYSVGVWHEGDSGYEVYNKTLQWLADYYYEIEESDNDALTAWRYAVFVMDAGELDLMDDLIIDLDQAYGSETKGMYECVVYEDGVGKFSIPVSCYWYLAEGDLTFELDKSDYDPSEAMVGTVASCSEVRSIFDSVRCDLIDGDGNIKTTYEKDLDGDAVVFDMQAPGTAGDYIARFTLYTEGFDFEYVHDVLFTVGGGSGDGESTIPDDWSLGGMWEWLNTTGGHWFLLLVMIAVATMLLWKHRIAVACVDLGLVGLWIVIGWIDVWLVVLLALGAGTIVWSIIRRRQSGGQ